MKTVKELLNPDIDLDEVDVITLHDNREIVQADSGVSEYLAPYLDIEVDDYEVEYDLNEGLVYLDIYVRNGV